MDKLTKLKKLQTYLKDKDFANFELQMELADYLHQVLVEKQGMKGDKGDNGERGIQGPMGRGERGPVGPEGKRGERGPIGKQGEMPDVEYIIRTVLASIPKPKDGKDAVLNIDEIVKKVLAKMPEQKLGMLPPMPPPHLMVKSSGTRVAEGIREINFTGATVTRVSGDQVQVAISATGSTFVYEEVCGGSGTSFTVANTPATGLFALFNTGGQRLRANADYTRSGANITTVDTFAAGELVADYQY